MVQTEFDVEWFGTNVLSLVASLAGFSFSLKSIFLGLSSLRRILSQKFEKRCTLSFINGSQKSVDGWWRLKSHEKDSLLTLNSNILRPFHETGKISNGLNVTTNSEVTGILLEKRFTILLTTGS
jgi:hypothetical protein